MKRGSIVGPVLLIGIGVLFLVNNLRPDLPTLKLVSEWWPFLLIVWGVGRILEITIQWQSGKPLPPRGLSGGEWTLAVLLCLIGSALFYGQRVRDHLPAVRITGLEMLGESFEYQQPEKRIQAGKAPRIRIENPRGNTRVTGIDTEEVAAKAQTSIRAFSQAEADKANGEAPFEVVKQGDVIVIRSNQDRASGTPRISTDIEVTAPKGSTVEGKGRYGDFDVNDVTGSLSVDSDNAGVRAGNIGGDVRIEARRSDILRAVNVKGNVEIRGSGSDVDLENIEGTSTVNGSFHGDLVFRKLAKPFRFESSNTELRIAKIPGRIEMSRGQLTGDELGGPIFVRSRSKDVLLSGFTDSLELQVDKGDVELRPGKLPLGKMNVRIRGGNVDLALPEAARFELNAVTERGDLDNDLGSKFQQERHGRGGRISGSNGPGPSISVHTDRGRISVRHSHAGDEPPRTLTRAPVSTGVPPPAPPPPAPPDLVRQRQ